MTASSPRLPASFTLTPSHTADIVPFQRRTPGQWHRGGGGHFHRGHRGTENPAVPKLPVNMPPIVVVQHMRKCSPARLPAGWTPWRRLRVQEAEQGDVLKAGTVYIAPGHSHVLITASGGGLSLRLSDAPEVNRHRPSVDVLFRSAANVLGRAAIGVILTGMGRDGARGMAEMKQCGGLPNLAQDEASCVVFGMPKESIALGGVNEVLPLTNIASRLIALCEKRTTWPPH